MNKHTLHYGNPNPLPQRYLLHAGELEVIYENGCLRYISAHKVELIRNIYSAVRDKNWGTILPEIIEEDIDIQQNNFKITYTTLYKSEEINFIAHYQILGKADSSIFLTMKGKALNTFQKNRIGFCILHPLQGVKGRECTVTTPTNEVVKAYFPKEVSATSPMKNIKKMVWENEVATCELSFEGDVWEMEDHRNWTDSSFKTFCTPLSISYPVEIEKNTEINQQILVTIKVKEQKKNEPQTDTHTFFIDNTHTYKFPKIGLSNATNRRKLTENESLILQKARFNHLRFDLKFSEKNWQENFENALYNAEAMSASLELVLHFTPHILTDLVDCQGFAKMNDIDLVSRVWLIDEKKRITSSDLITNTVKELRKIFPEASIGGGVDAHFAEFNQNLFDAELLDFVTFAVTPQAHAFDNDSLVENIEAQFDVLEGAKKLYPNKQVQISPITLRQRFNVVATSDAPETPENQLPYAVDARQMSLFAAGWTLGSLNALIKGRCDAVTYYETVGWQGVIQGEVEPTKPALFAGRKGDIFPIYHLFAFLNRLQLAQIQFVNTSNPLSFSALNILAENHSFLILTNHTNEKIDISIEKNSFNFYKKIDEGNALEALKDFLFLETTDWQKINNQIVTLNPYSLTFLQN